MKENKMSPPAVYCTLCSSPFQTIEGEEDAAIPSALADTTWLEKARLLGRSYGGFSGTLLSRTWIGVRAPLTGTRLKTPAFFIEGQELRVFVAEREGENLFSVQDYCLEIAKRVARGARGSKRCIDDCVDSGIPICGYGGRKRGERGLWPVWTWVGERLFWGEEVTGL
jgi:hypothetical protein